MSYDMVLQCGDEVCLTDPHTEGATYCVGGQPECDLNITGNYSRVYNFRNIDGLTGEESLPILQDLIERLGTEQSDNYWDPTPGNVGHVASVLHQWASEHPDGVWRWEP